MNYHSFFEKATAHEPFPYQANLAEGGELPTLLRIQTGAGKTEAAVLGWMYRRFEHPRKEVRSSTPRRLVYCLPMRTLVDQTAKRIDKWIEKLDMAEQMEVVSLMGGEPRTQWYLYPEKPTIIIGTQDMVLSRALNRGYASSPFMWPVEYGLLNNDSLWVMDEVQLMANGLPTSTQLAGLRRTIGSCGPSHSMWMSATVSSGWLSTIDHPAPTAMQTLELDDADLTTPTLARRRNARKPIRKEKASNARNLGALIADKHVPGTLTLAIVNTVERAQEVYKALNNRRQVTLDDPTLLVHSRFRAHDRGSINDIITSFADDRDPSGPGLVVVATQAVEAGVDISARTLVTELAPWTSMVQRFGRCNRAGEHDHGSVFWVDTGERPQDTAPYDPADVALARKLLKDLEGKSVGPAVIEGLSLSSQDEFHDTVIRRRDVIGLFDTTPDLSGGYLDVSQYVRGSDERDVSIFWRPVGESGPDPDAPKPRHAEIVSVPIGGGRGGLKGVWDYLSGDGRRAWRWDFLDNEWQTMYSRDIRPGMTLMLDAAQGGYSPEVGWDPSAKGVVDPVPDESEATSPEDGQGLDPNSISQSRWVTLSEHSRNVEAEVNAILNEMSEYLGDPEVIEAVRLAALYHDVGKAHWVFQRMLRKKGEDPPADGILLAKSRGNGKMDSNRRHFRHELGSALAVLQHTDGRSERTRDLAAYLAASHHGKVRLGIRSLPGRKRGRLDSNPSSDYLLGYPVDKENAETLPLVNLGDGLAIAETQLDMSVSEIGLSASDEPSWTERSLRLLEWLGPFRLAYLEAIVRAADMRASKKERETAQ